MWATAPARPRSSATNVPRARPSLACGPIRIMPCGEPTIRRRSQVSEGGSRSLRATCCRYAKAAARSTSTSADGGPRTSPSPSPSATNGCFRPQASSRRRWPGAAFGCAAGSRNAGVLGSKRRVRNRSKWWSAIKVRRRTSLRETRGRRGWLNAAVAALIVCALGGCATYVNGYRQESAAQPPRQAETLAPSQREHQRILATYGGAYQDARLEALITRVVEQLVAASERPDLKYRVTILNSPAVNAFALPNGQLYVTRGLLALGSDSSEIASVLSHEMAHVIARHAALREDQARQAALISRVATDVFNDPQMSALTLAKSKLALAGFSRAQELEADGLGVGLASSAGYDTYGAVRFLTSMGRNSDLKPSTRVQLDPRAADFLSSHPATPERVRVAQSNARQYSAPGTGERERDGYLAS